MSFKGMLSMLQTVNENVLTLVPTEALLNLNLKTSDEVLSDDPLMDLMTEFSGYELVAGSSPLSISTQGLLVKEEMSDEQIFLTLKNQLRGVSESVNRLRFFLTEIDDSIRR